MSTFVFKEESLPKKLNFGIWFKILKYALDKWYYMLGIVVSLIIISFYDSSFTPLMNASMVDSLRYHQAGTELIIKCDLIFGIHFEVNFIWFAIIMVAGILLRSVFIFINFFVTNLLECHLSFTLRRKAFKRVQELSFSYFDKTPKGWLIARLQSDCSDISEMVAWVMFNLFWIMFDLLFSLVSMFTLSWKLSLVILATTPILIIALPLFQKRLLKLHRISRNAYSNFVRWLAEVISGSKTIKTLAIEDEVENEAVEVTEDIKNKRFKAMVQNAYIYPLISIMSAITCGLIVVFGSTIFGLQNDVKMFVAFIGFVSAIYNPIQNFSEIFADFMANQASVEKVLQLVNTQPEIVDTPEVIAKYGTLFDNKIENFEPMEGDIVFKDISFSYDNNIEVIHHLNLHIRKGETVAIVGETGSGKTTTVNLLCRFYEPTSGQLLIDGVDYKKRSVGWIRSNIGYVQQNPFVFNETFKDNIKYGKLNASDEEVVAAAKIVDIHDFIMAQPNGYETVLEDGGNQLSLGQKQLISFARAVLRNPKIMILDEATSSVDTETEATIQKAINNVLKGRTSIMIAHRLSTVVDADRIIVMSDGVIVEEGSHIDLINKKGWYHHLYMNQFKELNIDDQIEQYDSQIKNKNIKL